MRSGRQLAVLIATLAALLLAAPGAASAASTFTVNEVGDLGDANTGDGVCDRDLGTSDKQCTLRAAVEQANAGAGSHDTIKFGEDVIGDTIALTSTLVLTTPMDINAGDCGDMTVSHKPCVRVHSEEISVTADDVLIRGLSRTGSTSEIGVLVNIGANDFRLQNSWVGMDLGQASGGLGQGVFLAGKRAVIGGTSGSARNVFAYDAAGVRIKGQGGNGIAFDENKVQGNYFGVKADGTTNAPLTQNAIEIEGTNGTDLARANLIGATLSSTAASTPTCDGGCNVIANAGVAGINLDRMPDQPLGGPLPATETKVKGNFIGLDRTGTVAKPNPTGIELGDSHGNSVGGDGSRYRNVLTGGTRGINEEGLGDATIQSNYFGLRSDGTAALNPPGFAGMDLESGNQVRKNRIAADPAGAGIRIEKGVHNVVTANKIGVGVGGANVGGGLEGILITDNSAENTIGGSSDSARNTIGNATDGIRILGSSTFAADNHKIKGNYIGTDADGNDIGNAQNGILIAQGTGSADQIAIGGDSKDSENVISFNGANAIRISSDGDGNVIKRNRGKDNDDPFIDLGTPGGGSGGTNNGILTPMITNVDPGDVTRSHITGSGANPGATIYIFRTASLSGSPPRINGFVDTAVANGSGDWSANFPQIPSGQTLTALQLDATDGSSELQAVVDPVGP